MKSFSIRKDESEIMKYKIIVLDLDGTLTNSKKEISPATHEALIDIQKQGYKVVLASGRPTPGVIKHAKELHLKDYGGYILSFNGAKIIDCRTDKVMFQKTLPPEVIPELYRIAVEAGVGIISYDEGKVIAGTHIDEYIELEAGINGLEINLVSDFVSYINYPVNKCLMTGEHEILLQVQKQLKSRYNSLLSIYFSEPFFLEIMPQNIDKAQSLLTLLNTIGISSDEMICCGDGFNDISMIQTAGLGVAMENAQDIVKEAADYITRSNDDEGILYVIQKFMSNNSDS